MCTRRGLNQFRHVPSWSQSACTAVAVPRGHDLCAQFVQRIYIARGDDDMRTLSRCTRAVARPVRLLGPDDSLPAQCAYRTRLTPLLIHPLAAGGVLC